MSKPASQSSIVLFTIRLVFYFSVITLIFFHPGIAVSFDRISAMQWFIIVPLMTVAAYQSVFAVSFKKRLILALVTLTPLSIIAGGFSTDAFMPFIAGFIGFIFTLLLFHHQRMPFHPGLAKITALEPFFLAWVCLRLLSLSRSSEEIAEQSVFFTQFILIWTLVVFLFHNVVIYLCLYPNSRIRSWNEGLAFFSGAALSLFILIFVLPSDFVSNIIIENLVTERIPQKLNSETERGIPQRGSGRRTLPGERDSGQGELRGISEHEWPGSGNGSGENRQYMVKIVASDTEPLYMGDTFRGLLDPVYGFLPSPQEPVNDLSRQRLFTSWSNNEYSFDAGRVKKEIFSLSTLRYKYFPWNPVSADPVILQENAGPLRYIHQVVSNIHTDDPLKLVSRQGRLLNDNEKSSLAHYLEIPLNAGDRNQFEAFLNNALDEWRKNRTEIIEGDRYLKSLFENASFVRNAAMENILAILTGFSEYQYNLSDNEDSSIETLKNFLFYDKEGDCTEFSNTLALLGRLAGIPSRVVTGYLAAESLQTPAHLSGLAVLQRQIPVLQQFPFDHLFMVTNLHSHSWTQFYIPGYGWLDFEATSFAIPPVGMGDFNNWDIVIPILDDNKTFSQIRKFPWQAAGRAAAALVIIALVCAYVLRYGRELTLFIGSNGGGRNGARCLYLLLLARLAADGQPIKPASKTAHEYADLFLMKRNKKIKDAAAQLKQIPDECFASVVQHFKNFADIYSAIRWREFNNENEMNERFNLLKREYRNILNSTRKRGLHHAVKRVISLRGLAYL